MQYDGIPFGREEDAILAGLLPVAHLPERDAKSSGVVFGDGMPLGKFAQLGDGLFQARIPPPGDLGGMLGLPAKRLDGASALALGVKATR